MRCQAFAIYEHLSDRAVSKKRESQNTEGCDDLTDNADDCVRGVIADDPAGDADTDRNGNENDQCEICGPKRDHIECAETGNDQHCDRKNDSDCLHKNAPSDEYICVQILYHNFDKMENFSVNFFAEIQDNEKVIRKKSENSIQNL